MSSGGEANDFFSNESLVRGFPVHRACRDGDLGALASLLQHFTNRVHLNVEDSCYGWTPMHWATHFGQLECIMCLVQMGCEVNRPTSRFKQTPAHIAAFAGHSRCVEWFTLAGADINRQDLLGEAPIHKAARSGSLDCMQALLLAGAKPNLRNSSGQTPADVAQAHGFHDCFDLIVSKSLPHGRESGAVNRAQIGHDQHQHHGRKRPLNTTDSERMKKARRAERAVPEQVTISREEEVESMCCDSTQDSGTNTTTADSRLPRTPPCESEPAVSPTSPPANQQASGPPICCRPAAATCGSLHWTEGHGGFPGPSHWEAECADFLLYGHYHGFGDTAEELSYKHTRDLYSSSSTQL